MTQKIANIAKNTSYFTIALIMQKVISFTYFTIIARALVPDDLGKYYFAISFTSIFSMFIDIGLTNVLTREVARPADVGIGEGDNDKRANDLLRSVMAIKIPLAFLSLLLVFIIINLMGKSDTICYLVYLSSICMILDSFTATLFAVVRGFHNLVYESIASVIFMLVALVTGVIILKMNLGLVWLMIALVSASVFNIIYSTILVRGHFKLSLWPKYDKALIKKILIITAPFAVYAIVQRFYTYFDSVLLTQLAGDRYTGLYQIPFKIINALQFLPMAFVATIYPAFSSYWLKNKDQIMITFERSLNYLIIISLPISIGTIALADKIIIIFKSQYNDAILPLQITMASLLFIFINFPIGSLLNACDRQKDNTRNIIITTIASVVLNVILIPIYKTNGASITVLVTNVLMFMLGMIYVPKIITLRVWVILKFFLKAFSAALLMGIFVYFMKSYVNIFIVVFLSALVYFLFIYIFKAVNKEDVYSILKSFKKV